MHATKLHNTPAWSRTTHTTASCLVFLHTMLHNNPPLMIPPRSAMPCTSPYTPRFMHRVSERACKNYLRDALCRHQGHHGDPRALKRRVPNHPTTLAVGGKTARGQPACGAARCTRPHHTTPHHTTPRHTTPHPMAPAAVAKFKYTARCVAHKCPGHPYEGPLYYPLHTVGTLPAELHPALMTHLREHHGDLALLAPHGLATEPPQVLAPKTEPGISFHDLPALATLHGTIVAVDAGATPAGMAMAGVAQCGLGA